MNQLIRRLALPLTLLAAVPLPAQTLPGAPQVEEDKGFDLMEEGAKLLFRGLMREMEPTLNEMGKALSDMEPALQNLMALAANKTRHSATSMPAYKLLGQRSPLRPPARYGRPRPRCRAAHAHFPRRPSIPLRREARVLLMLH